MNKKSVYTLHPAFAYQDAIVANLKDKTGRNIDEWKKAVMRSGIKIEKEQKEWLKKEHGLGGTTVSVIIDYIYARGGAENYNPERYVDEMFSGKKEALRPLYEKLLELCFSIGKEIKISPTKTMISVYRNHVIAQIKPATNTRIDLGLAIKEIKAAKRLVSTGGSEKGDRITQSIPVTKTEDIDSELKSWLQKAFDLDK